MKKLFVLSQGFLLLLLINACTKEDLTTQETKEDIVSTAQIAFHAISGDEPDSKTILAGTDLKNVNWCASEKINVFYKNKSYIFTSTNTKNVEETTFVGEIEGITDSEELEEPTIALYPYNADATINNGVITTSLPSQQTAVANTFANQLAISLAKGNQTNFLRFYNVCSGFCFTVRHINIKTVVIRGKHNEPLAGKFKVKLSDEGLPVVTEVVDGESMITLQLADGSNFKQNVKYFAVTLPVEFPDGLIVEGFTPQGAVYELSIDKPVEFKRSVFARKLQFENGMTAQYLWDFTLDVTYPEEEFTVSGETKANSLKVASYRTLKSDPTVKLPVAWKSQVSSSGDESGTYYDLTPERKVNYGAGWLSFGAYSATPKDANVALYDVVASPNGATNYNTSSIHTMALKSKTHKSGIDNSLKENAIDLSMYDVAGNPIAQSTANCYVVSSPGWYKIPMVYGNAIKNGATNTKAYISSATQVQNTSYYHFDAVLMNMVDHLGAYISQPWVTDAHAGGAYTISKVALLWQDAKTLVTQIQKGSDANADYIYFYIAKGTIQEGNAVIAAYDADSIIAWSWHIWVSSIDLTKTTEVTNSTGLKYDFMPVNLGWCDTKSITGGTPPKKSYLRIAQSIGSNMVNFTLSQEGEEITVYDFGNCLNYAWGRKDPFIGYDPTLTGSMRNKTWYDASGSQQNNKFFKIEKLSDSNGWAVHGEEVIKNTIQKPNVANYTRTADMQFYNLWSTDQNVTNGATNDYLVPFFKTIYDPCPVGFCVPDALAYTGFAKNYSYTKPDSGDCNIVGTYQKGWNFYTNPSRTETVFMGSCGSRRDSWYGNLSADNMFWTNGVGDWGYGIALYVASDGVTTKFWGSGGEKADSFSIRPVKEK